MDIESVVELAKLEGRLDTLTRLIDLKLIENDEIEDLYYSIEREFSEIHNRGGMNSKLGYDISVQIIDMFNEYGTKKSVIEMLGWEGKIPPMEEVLTHAHNVRAEHDLIENRKNSEYHVEVMGSNIYFDNDGENSTGYEMETGPGGNTLKEAFDILKNFEVEYRNAVDSFYMQDSDDSYLFSPKSARITDKTGDTICHAIWDHKLKRMTLSEQPDKNKIEMLSRRIDELVDERIIESRADNYSTSRFIQNEINFLKSQLVSDKWLGNEEVKVLINAYRHQNVNTPSDIFRQELSGVVQDKTEPKNISGLPIEVEDNKNALPQQFVRPQKMYA